MLDLQKIVIEHVEEMKANRAKTEAELQAVTDQTTRQLLTSLLGITVEMNYRELMLYLERVAKANERLKSQNSVTENSDEG